jgi:glycosyltransferase involved in cell wall biosynthesis
MLSPSFDVHIFTPVSRKKLPTGLVLTQTLPWHKRFVPYRFISESGPTSVERKLFAQLGPPTCDRGIVYLWPGASMYAVEELKRRGFSLVREMTNCHRASAKRILDEAYSRWGVSPQHGISQQSTLDEIEQLAFMDYIFCPNEMVEQSVREANGEGLKLLSTSYGWDPGRFASATATLQEMDGVTVLFVGSINVRKGVHLLLEIWKESKISGRLILAGKMDPLIAQRCSDVLNREDVVVMDYVDDIASLYRSADIFVFPTIEEGGPQVTYEAAANSLAVITTPMGKGRILEDGQNGFVRDPFDRDGWIDCLRMLANSREWRTQIGAMARKAADAFTWDKVGARRRHQLQNIWTPRKTALLRGGMVETRL